MLQRSLVMIDFAINNKTSNALIQETTAATTQIEQSKQFCLSNLSSLSF